MWGEIVLPSGMALSDKRASLRRDLGAQMNAVRIRIGMSCNYIRLIMQLSKVDGSVSVSVR